jgi:hypothetical protein
MVPEVPRGWWVAAGSILLAALCVAGPARSEPLGPPSVRLAAYYGDPPDSLFEASEPYAATARAAFRFCVAYSIQQQLWTEDSSDCERALAAMHAGPPAVEEFFPQARWNGRVGQELFPPDLPAD